LWPSLAGLAAGADVLDLIVISPFASVARWNIAPVVCQAASKKARWRMSCSVLSKSGIVGFDLVENRRKIWLYGRISRKRGFTMAVPGPGDVAVGVLRSRRVTVARTFKARGG
jgi:hypothetical protein